MKTTELFEDRKKTYEVTFRLGRHSRKQQFTSDTITKCKALSQAEIRTILRFDLGETMTTSFVVDGDRTIVTVVRTK